MSFAGKSSGPNFTFSGGTASRRSCRNPENTARNRKIASGIRFKHHSKAGTQKREQYDRPRGAIPDLLLTIDARTPISAQKDQGDFSVTFRWPPRVAMTQLAWFLLVRLPAL